MLEEESLKELEAKNAKFVHFIVSDASKAAQIISKLFQTRNMQIADSYNLYLYDTTLPVAKINRALWRMVLTLRKRISVRTLWRITSKRLQGVRGLLKLIKCEFWKLKRKHFVSFVVFAALLYGI